MSGKVLQQEQEVTEFKAQNKVLKEFSLSVEEGLISLINEKACQSLESQTIENLRDLLTKLQIERQEYLCKKILAKSNDYDVLEVSNFASADELKKAFKALSLIFHPDKNKAPSALEAF